MSVFIYLMHDENPLNSEIVKQHIAHLRRLDENGALILCGPFTDYSGGMVVFRALNKEAATIIAMQDPFIAFGYKTFEIRTLEVADASNDYLG